MTTIYTDRRLKILTSFKQHLSPKNESSLFKGIHILNLPLFKKEFRGLFRYRPRGGRYHIQYNCTMKDAKTFAVYPR